MPALSPFGQEQSPGDGKPSRPVGQSGGKARLATGPHGLKALLAGDYRRWTPPEQTDKWLDNHWAEFSKRFDRQNNRFSKVQKDLFRRQLEAVIRRLRQSGMVFGLVLFEPAQWIEEFLAQGREPMIAALATNANAQIDAYRLGISFDLSRPAVQEWIDRRIGLWTTLTNEETARLLNQEVVAALDAGESIRDMQGRVEKVFNFNDVVRSERIARTEMLSASNRGALEAYRQSGVVERKRWLATRDSRVRDAHAEANGQTVALEAPFLVMGESIMAPGEGSPGNSINCRCHPAGTVVDARSLQMVYRRWYEGELVEITTTLGNKLAGTPNHPVLTDAGWIALGNLAEGDHVISSAFGERMGAADPDIDHVPAKIGDLYDALAVAGDRQRVDGSPMDFHGDGRQGKIDVVAPNYPLPQWAQPTALKHGEHFRFALAHRQMSRAGDNAPLERVKKPELVGVAASAPLDIRRSQPGGNHIPASVESICQAQFGLARDIPLDDTVIVQPQLGTAGSGGMLNRQALPCSSITEQPPFLQAGRHPARLGAVSPANSLNTLTGQVVPDRVLNISIWRFVGHVYNLQTAEGFYAANGIIAHNCTIVPILDQQRNVAPTNGHRQGVET